MLRILSLVAKDLWEFALSRKSIPETVATPHILPTPQHTTELLAAPSIPPLIPEVFNDAETELEEAGPQTFRSIKDILAPHTDEEVVDIAAPSVIRRTMVVGRADEPLFVRQVREYDGIMARIPYGASVSAGVMASKWVEVLWKDMTGWVDRDALYEHINQTRPYFVVKEFCSSESENTKRLRNVIHDEFAGGVLGLPLQAEEYVYYRLFVTGAILPMTSVRPRTAGGWQRIYRGLPGVKIGVRPKTGAVMEYYDVHGVGHLAYIEAVFPDESITVSEVGEPEQGYYNEMTLTREAWMTLQPVFIQSS